MPLPIETEHDTQSIVLVGSFNPTIFHPMWFAFHKLFSVEDAEAAEIQIVHPDISSFRTSRLTFGIDHQRFVVTVETIYRDLVRDLVLSCFGDILVHTPIRMMGINRQLHFSAGSEELRSKFGFEVAPPSLWGDWGKEIYAHAEQNWGKAHGGMMRLVMRQQPRPDDHTGYIQADVQPSVLVRNNSGVFIQVNDHFEIPPDDEHSTLNAMNILDQAWKSSGEKAEKIISDVMLRASGKAT